MAIEKKAEETEEFHTLGNEIWTFAGNSHRKREDRMATLDDQLLWLRQAGFTDISTWYRYYNFVVFSGKKLFTTSGQQPN